MKIAILFYYEWLFHDKFISGSINIDGWGGGVYGTVGEALNLTKSHYNTVKKWLMRLLMHCQKVRSAILFVSL